MFHFIEVVRFFSDHKNPALISGVYLLISSSSSVTFESIRKTLKIQKKTLENILSNLDDMKLLRKENEFFFVEKIILERDPSLPAVTPPKQLPVSMEVDKIIHHLNDITGKRFRATANNHKDITKFLALGHTVESFLLVNQYFSVHWNNPSMVSNINPGTLYNKKFPERVQIAENYFGIISNNRDDVYSFISFFNKLHSEFIDSKNRYSFSNSDLQSLLFWLNNGYDIAVIKNVVSFIVKEWSVNVKFRKHLIPSTLLNDKWPSRVVAYNTQNSHIKLEKCLSSSLQSIVESLAVQPDIGAIRAYNQFFSKSDPVIFDRAVQHLGINDARYSYRLTPLVKFMECYKNEATKALRVFLNGMANRGNRSSDEESLITDQFVEWFGGWNRIESTDLYIWINSIPGFLKHSVSL